jgi:hypothetical protein
LNLLDHIPQVVVELVEDGKWVTPEKIIAMMQGRQKGTEFALLLFPTKQAHNHAIIQHSSFHWPLKIYSPLPIA